MYNIFIGIMLIGFLYVITRKDFWEKRKEFDEKNENSGPGIIQRVETDDLKSETDSINGGD